MGIKSPRKYVLFPRRAMKSSQTGFIRFYQWSRKLKIISGGPTIHYIFFSNEEIFVELDELDKITHAWT